MRTYKKLKSRKKETDKRSSINEIHETKMKNFLEYYATLPKKRKELQKLEEEYLVLKDMTYQEQQKNNKDSFKQKEEIDKLKEEIFQMENQTDMLNYLSNVQHIFMKIDNNNQNMEESEASKADSEASEEISPVLKDKINAGIKKYIKITKKNNRENLVDEFINAMNGIGEVNRDNENLKKLFKCDNCKSYLLNDSSKCNLVCEKCGTMKQWQDPDLAQWSDEVDFSKTYRYKKLGYFIEHLYRMQAQECTTIPDYVINNVLMKLREKRINSNEKIDKKTIKMILKELDMTNYYDNINSIIRTISGKEAPKFPEDLEEKLISMFMRTLEPFEKNKNLIPSRSNYLSYPYAIRKLLEILSRIEPESQASQFVQYFGLLKSRNKTWEHERVWKKICKENNWPFIPSI